MTEQTTETKERPRTAPARRLVPLDPDVWRECRILAMVERRPVWRLIDQALREYLGRAGKIAP